LGEVVERQVDFIFFSESRTIPLKPAFLRIAIPFSFLLLLAFGFPPMAPAQVEEQPRSQQETEEIDAVASHLRTV